MSEKFEYIIDSKKYIQRPLVWGQIKQLKAVLPSLAIPAGVPLEQGLLLALTDHLPLLLAVVLIPDGISPKDKDIDVLAGELEFAIDMETALKVVADFFDCNPITFLADTLEGILKPLMDRRIKPPIPSMSSSVSSPEETLPNEKPSSGAAVLETPSPILNSKTGT